jgi:hypothetical protein
VDNTLKSVFTPIGGANQDDSLITPSPDAQGKSMFEIGDYRYALNLRLGSSRDDNFGDAETPKSTLEITGYVGYDGNPTTPPTGINKVNGKYEDNEFQRIYEAVWNSNGNHTIRYFDPGTATTYELIRWAGLNFLEDGFIKLAKLDNWLAFTDRNSPPRLIDTDTISSLFLSLGANFREFHISLHKWAPTVPPIPRVYYDGSTNNYEKLKNKNLQFSYRYIYYGNLKSRFSPISKGAVTTRCGVYYTPGGSPGFVSKQITSIEVDMPGCIYDDPSSGSSYNYFDHSNVKFTSAVQYIELAFREGELELWKQWKIVDAASFNRYQYFNGDANLTPLDQNDFEQPFDTVPLKAGTIEAADNRFVLADVLDEEEPAEPIVATDVAVVTDLTSGTTNDWRDSFNTSFPALSASAREDILRKNSLSDYTFKDRGVYKVGIQWLSRTGWRSALYTTDDLIFKPEDTNRILAFNFKLSVTPPEWAVGYQVFRTNALNIEAFIYGIVNKFTPLVDDTSTILDQLEIPEDLKNRIRQHFDNEALVDANELIAYTETQISGSGKNQTDSQFAKSFLTEQAQPFNNGGSFTTKNLQFVTGIGKNSFINQLKNKNNKKNPISTKLQQQLRKTKQISAIANASRIFIDINNWYFGSKKAVDNENPLNKLFYNFREGDRVRFVGSDVASPTSESQLKEYDVPIIEFTGKGLLIERPEGLLYIQGNSNPTGFYHYDIEVYTPKIPSELDHLFYETGEWYPVLYPGTASRALVKTDFTYTNNASVTATTAGPFNFFNKIPLFYGDCFTVQKTVYRDSTVESVGNKSSGIPSSMNPDPDNTFGYWDKNNGRVSITYRNIPVSSFKGTMARFGGKIIEQSFVNALNTFFFEDQFVYPSEYGRIRNIINTSNAQVESVGSILLAIGEREAWSIYVNRTTLEDLSGNTQVLISDKVLGSYNTLLGSHGTLNPESISKYRGNVYWWDALNGTWIRYGRDGLTAISDYKKRNWFKQLGSLLLPKYMTSEKPRIISEFDPYNMELITFMDHSELPATFRGYSEYKGDTFSENDKRWKMCHSYTPEMFAKLNNDLYAFNGGLIYKLEAGEDYLSFFGSKKDAMIEPVFNINSPDVKHWRGIVVVSTDKWSVERILSEYRGQKNIIQSSILLEQFDDREDAYWGAIRQDINTPNVTNPIVEGRDVRCKAIQVLLKLNPDVDSLSLLHYAFGHYTESVKNQ